MCDESKCNCRTGLTTTIVGALLGGAVGAGLMYWLVSRRSVQAEFLQPREIEPIRRVEPDLPATVLIIDDDQDYVELTSAILTQAGYRVTTASSSEDAFRVMQHDKPDMVLLDVMMTAPLEGISISRKMAADRALKNIPIVMISGIGSSEYSSTFPEDIDVPIDAWISKPVDPDQVLQTVKHVLAR